MSTSKRTQRKAAQEVKRMRAAVKAAPSKRRGRRRRKSNTNMATTHVSTGPSPVMTMGQGAGFVTRNPTSFKTGSGASHPEWGPGIRVKGSSYYVSVNTTSGSSSAFAGYPTETGNSANTVNINPYSLDPNQLWNIAQVYSRYAIRDLTLTYVPACNTQKTNTVGLCIQSDPSSAEIVDTFLTVVATSPSVATPFYYTASLRMKYDGPMTWFVDEVVATETAIRQVSQAVLIGYMATTANVTEMGGYIFSDYVIDFYGRQGKDTGPPTLSSSMFPHFLSLLETSDEKTRKKLKRLFYPRTALPCIVREESKDSVRARSVSVDSAVAVPMDLSVDS